jgi:proteic killer suppression protein
MRKFLPLWLIGCSASWAAEPTDLDFAVASINTSCSAPAIHWVTGATISPRYATGKGKRIPADVAKRAARKLEYVDLATSLDDLRVPPGNRLHALTGDRKGQHSISVNDQWRICFRLVDGDAYDVEFCDYH